MVSNLGKPFSPTQKLRVLRTLMTGHKIEVGTLAQSRRGVFFQYNAEYLDQFGNLSPFTLKETIELQPASPTPHGGLHGVFADSLPDGWGLLLQDRSFRQHGILPAQVTAMDRLAFVGESSLGALSYAPASCYADTPRDIVDMATLGIEAQAVFDGQTDEVLSALVAAGSSGGARPKAQLYRSENGDCRTRYQAGDSAWIVKFTSRNLPLGHEEGLCEAAYLEMAKRLNLNPPEWVLLDAPKASGAAQWLAIKRFDWHPPANKQRLPGRYHLHSACGLLDADFRSPSLDYEDFIKASRQLCRSPAVGQLQFKRALFNLLACNQDDHSKNWAFLQDDQGSWQPAPFYDITFSPHPFGEQATAFSGYGKKPPLKVIQRMAQRAGFSHWEDVRHFLEDLVEVLNQFSTIAQSFGVKSETIRLIDNQLNTIRRENSLMLSESS